MPLHLLGKKSWNVYNSANVERVQRDEAEARAKEEAEEQRIQEEDAQRRIAILRGEKPAPLVEVSEENDDLPVRKSRDDDSLPLGRKRKRIRGEDETDREIRYAREDVEAGEKAKTRVMKQNVDDAPLHDHAGHFQLIPAPDERAIRNAEKNAEAEAEKAKRKKREEDQYTMRFSNAAGFADKLQKPWYSASKAQSVPTTDMCLVNVQNKDVWGNEDPRRRERELKRVNSSDPFAFMQQAQRQLKQSERDREAWQTERDKEMEELRRVQKTNKRERGHRRRSQSIDSLEDFHLDSRPKGEPGRGARDIDDKGGRRHRHHHHHRRHRSRSRSKSRHRDRHQK